MPLDAPLGRPQLAAHEAQQGRLARAVGPQQGAVRSAPHLPADVVQHVFLAGIAGQKKAYVFDGYDNVGHKKSVFSKAVVALQGQNYTLPPVKNSVFGKAKGAGV